MWGNAWVQCFWTAKCTFKYQFYWSHSPIGRGLAGNTAYAEVKNLKIVCDSAVRRRLIFTMRTLPVFTISLCCGLSDCAQFPTTHKKCDNVQSYILLMKLHGKWVNKLTQEKQETKCASFCCYLHIC
jgi:hypothetical protein